MEVDVIPYCQDFFPAPSYLRKQLESRNRMNRDVSRKKGGDTARRLFGELVTAIPVTIRALADSPNPSHAAGTYEHKLRQKSVL